MAGFVQEDGNWGEVGCAGGDKGGWGGGYGRDFRAAGDLCGEVGLGMMMHRYLISRLGRELGGGSYEGRRTRFISNKNMGTTAKKSLNGRDGVRF